MKLRRTCRRCDEWFRPNGRFCKFCEKCKKRGYSDRRREPHLSKVEASKLLHSLEKRLDKIEKAMKSDKNNPNYIGESLS